MAEDNTKTTTVSQNTPVAADTSLPTEAIPPVAPVQNAEPSVATSPEKPQDNEGTHGLVDPNAPQDQAAQPPTDENQPAIDADSTLTADPDDLFNPDDIQTAAGGGGGGGGGGSGSFGPYDPGNLGGGRGALDLLGALDLTTSPLKGIPGAGGGLDDGVTGRATSNFLAGSGFGYENATPYAYLGDYSTQATLLNLVFTPQNGVSLSSVSITLPTGVGLSVNGGNAVFGTVIVPASQINNLVLISSSYDDSDFDLIVTPVVIDRLGASRTLAPITTNITIDAVAQRPEGLTENLEDDGSSSHVMSSTTTTTQSFIDQKDTTEYRVTAMETEGRVNVTVNIGATFQDFDSSEKHYILVEKLPGFSGDYTTITENGVSYFQIPVSNAALSASGGSVVVPVVLQAPQTVEDTYFSVRTGAMSVENPTDNELTTTNNTAVVINREPLGFTIDIVNSALTVQVGWASEGGNPNKDDTAQEQSPALFSTFSEEALATPATIDGRAPITLTLSGASGTSEAIQSVTFTFSDERGTLEYSGPGSMSYSTDSSGTATYVITGVNAAALTGLFFVPATSGPQSYNDADVALNYTVTATNAAGATAIFSGASTVTIDAVADLSTSVTASIHDASVMIDTTPQGSVTTINLDLPFANPLTGWENDAFTNLYCETRYALSINVATTFPDIDSSEKHYILIQRPDSHWSLGTLPAGYADAGTYTGSDGKTYFKIEVTDSSQGSVNVDIPLRTSAVSGDMDSVTIKTGSLAQESSLLGQEYDSSNNTAERLDGTALKYGIDVINSTLIVRTGWASEGDNDAKHLGQPSTGYDYHGFQAGSTVTGPHDSNIGAPINLSILGSDGTAETISTATFTYDGTRGTLVYTGPGTATAGTNGSGNATLTITGIDSADLTGKLVFVPTTTGLQSYNDADIHLGYSITLGNTAGASTTFTGTSTVVIDAVADRSTTVASTVNDATSVIDIVPQGTVTTGGSDATAHSTTTGWETDTFSNIYAGTRYSLNVNIATTFPDTDGSEKHFVLIQKLSGWSLGTLPAGYSSAGTYTGSDGKTYFRIEVTDRTQGNVNITIPLKTDTISGDMNSVTLKTGSLVQESSLLGQEYDSRNNTAERLDGTALRYSIDVVNSTLTVKTGWASEDDNDAKHLGQPSTGYEYTGTQAGSTVTAPNDSNIGAPINLSIGSGMGSSETISAATFSFDTDRGNLVYTGSGTAVTSIDGSGHTTLTITGVNASDLTGKLIFIPATTGTQSYNDADVALNYTVIVKNAAGASATFNGTSTVILDAVADRSTTVTSTVNDATAVTDIVPQGTVTTSGTDAATHNATSGWETDTFSKTYSGTNYSLNVKVATTFADTDGSEKHFILIQQPNNGWSLGTLPSGYTSAGTYTGSDGNTYFKIEVTDPAQSTVNVTIPLNSSTVSGDLSSVAIKTGSLVQESTLSGQEYDTANNAAERLDGTALSYGIDVINSTLTVKTGWASEGDNDAKHLGQPSTGYGYTGTQAGSTVTGSGDSNIGAPINLSIGSATGSSETISSVTFTYDESRGALQYSGTGTVTQSTSGGIVTYSITGINATDLTGKLVFVPATTGTQSYNDADVALNYTVTATNAAGASATFTGTSTVILDAVADRSTTVTSTVNDATSVTDIVPQGTVTTSGTDAATHNATSGWETDTFAKTYSETNYSLSVQVATTFADTDGSEKHFILIQQPNNGWSLGTLPSGYTSAGTYTGSDGNTYFKIEVTDPAQSTVNVTIPLNSSTVSGDLSSVAIKTGSLVQESTLSGQEYDTANNAAERLDGTALSYGIDVINSTLTVKTGWASEGDNDAKHLGQPSTGYGYTGTQAGSTVTGSGDSNIGAPINLSIGSATGSSETISSVTFTYDESRGALQYSGTGTVTQSTSGGIVTYSITGINATDLTGKLVFVPATTGTQSYNDADVTLNYTVTATNAAGASATFTGTSTVILDAVADRSTTVTASLSGNTDNDDDEHDDDHHDDHNQNGGNSNVLGSTPVGSFTTGGVDATTHNATSGWETDTFFRTYTPTSDCITVKVTTTFPDIDGSEKHYILIQQPSNGWSLGSLPAGYGNAGTYTGSDGNTYFKIVVLDSTQGTVNVSIPLNSPTVNGDLSSVTIKTGSLVQESTLSGQEYDTANNAAERIDGTALSYGIDVINSTLTVKTGWASEGDNDAKHLGQPSTGYDYTGTQAGSTVTAPDHSNTGAPINLSIGTGTGSSETISAATFSFDAGRGTLVYTGAGTAVTGNDGSGHTTLTITGINATNLTGKLIFVPATTGTQSYNDADVNLNYSVTVKNAAGASATFNGTSTVILDAVADRSTTVTSTVNDVTTVLETAPVGASSIGGTDASAHNATSGWETDTFSKTYSPTSDCITVKVATTFPDTDGSEKHYILIQQPNSNWSLGTLPVGYGNAGTHTGSDGNTYFKISVLDSTQGTVNVSIPLNSPTINGDLSSVTIKTGSLAQESTLSGQEYDTANNTAERLDGTTLRYGVDVINSTLTVKTGWATEGDNDAKHLGLPSTGYDYTGTQAGSTATGSGNSNIGAPINLSIGSATGSSETISAATFSFDTGRGTLVYTGGGTAVTSTDGSGHTTLTITGINATDLTGKLIFVPATTGTQSYNDADVNLNYSVTVKNTAGASATFNGTSTVILDAVADRSTTVTSTVNDATSVTDIVPQGTVTTGGTDAATHNATTGWETDTFSKSYSGTSYCLNVKVATTFADTDGSEKHFILIQQPNSNWSLGTLPSGYISAGTYSGTDGKTYFKIEVTNPAQSSVNVTIPLNTNTVSGDMNSVTLKTGSLAQENTLSGQEYDTANNAAERLDGTALSYGIDVVNSMLSVQTGWASEGANDAKHLGTASSTYTYSGTQAASTSDGSAPITLSLSGAQGSSETIQSVTFTYDGSRGALQYSGSGTVTQSTSGGIVTYTIAGVNNATLTGLTFKPATTGDASFDHSDVDLTYNASVKNSAGAGASFSGTSTIVVDAVADKSAVTTYAVAYNSTQTAAKSGEDVVLRDKVTFPDTKGGEQHYVLIEAGLESSLSGVDAFRIGGYSLDGGTTYQSVTGLTPVTISGIRYYQIDVGATTASQDVYVKVNATSTSDKTLNVSVGGHVTVTGVGVEYDATNNVSTTVKNISFIVSPANSGSSLAAINTYESSDGTLAGIDANKHIDASSETHTATVSGVTQTYGQVSVANNIGDITFSLSSPDATKELITKVTFDVQGDLNTLGSLIFNGTPIPSWGGVGAAPVAYYQVSVDGLTTRVVITDTTPSDFTLTTKFIPAAYSDTDLKIAGYQINYINPKSFDTNQTNWITGSAGAPAATVIVDAVAAKAENLDTDVTYGTGQSSARAGDSVTLDVSVTIPEAADPNEQRYLILWDRPVTNGCTYTSVAFTLTGGGSITVPVGSTTITVDGQTYYRVAIPNTSIGASGQVTAAVHFTLPSDLSAHGLTADNTGRYTFTTKYGVMTSDPSTDLGITTRDDASFAIANAVTITTDTVASSHLTATGGAGYEANMPFDYLPATGANQTTGGNNETLGSGVPVVISGSIASGEYVSSVTLTIPAGRGSILYNGTPYTPDVDGKVTLTFNGTSSTFDTSKLTFIPAGHVSGAFDMGISVNITDSQSTETKTFDGLDAEIKIDAVANRSGVIIADSSYGTATWSGSEHTLSAFQIGSNAIIRVSATFDDNDSSEQHFALVEYKLGWGNPQGYKIVPYDVDGNGIKEMYVKVPVPNGQNSVNVILTPPSIGITSLKTGTIVEERNFDMGSELTTGNNVAFRPGPDISVKVVGHSGSSITAHDVYEDDRSHANVGNTSLDGGTIVNLSLPVGSTDQIIGSITLTCAALASGNPHGTLTYGGVPVVFNVGGQATITYDPAKQLVFKPTGHTDSDVSIAYSGTIVNTLSGHQTSIGGSTSIGVDAVAQLPTAVASGTVTYPHEGTDGSMEDGDDRDQGKGNDKIPATPPYVSTNETFTVPMSATFRDFDGSEKHYLLVEARPSWSVAGSNGTHYVDGKLYFTVPVDGNSSVSWTTNADGSRTASMTVGITTGSRFFGSDGEGTLRFGAMAVDTRTDSGEITYHNNFAANTGGTLSLNLDYSGIGGTDHNALPGISIGDVYENDTPNAHIGDMTLASESGDSGIISIRGRWYSDDNGWHYGEVREVALTYDPTKATIVYDGNPNKVTITNNPDGTQTILIDGPIVHNGLHFVPTPNSYNDKDVNIQYEIVSHNSHNTFETYTGTYSVWVDAVAQQSTAPEAEVEYDTGYTAAQSGGEVTVTVKATFPDHDGSENHYMLIEAKPGWNCLNGTMVYIQNPDTGESKAYFQVKVLPSQIDANGNAAVDVSMVVPSNAASQVNSDGKINYTLAVGTTSVENPQDGEITYDNNVAVKFSDGTVVSTTTIEVSVVNSSIAVSVPGSFYIEDYASPIPITVSGLAATDEIQTMSFDFEAALGTMIYAGKALIPGSSDLPSGVTVTQSGGQIHVAIANFVPGAQPMTFTLAGQHSSEDIHLGYNATVVDKYSGEVKNFNGTKTIVIDAQAHAPDVDGSVAYEGSHEAALAGHNALVTVNATFVHTPAGSTETPYILVERINGWTLTDPSGSGIDLFYPTGNYSGGTFFRIPVSMLPPSAVSDNGDGTYSVTAPITLRAPEGLHDVNASLRVGGLAVDSFSDGETNLINNWDQNLTTVDVKMAIVETQEINLANSGALIEDDMVGTPLSLGSLLDIDEIITTTSFTVTQVNTTSGTVIGHVVYNGVSYEVKAGEELSIAFGTNGFDAAKDFRFVLDANNHNSGQVMIDTSSTVVDTKSGDTVIFDDTHTIDVVKTADIPTNITVTDPSYGSVSAVGSGAPVAFTVSASFVDIDGSEQHYLLVEKKSGWTGAYPVVTVDGTQYFRVSVNGTAPTPTANIMLHTPVSGLSDGEIDLKVGGMSVDGSDTKVVFEPGDHVSVTIGVVDTTAVTAASQTVLEDHSAIIDLVANGHNETITAVVFTAPTTGTIYYNGLPVPAVGGYVTIAPFDETKELVFAAGDNIKGAFTLSYTATVMDNASGLSNTFNGSTTVTVTPVTDIPVDLEHTTTDPVDQAGHIATLSMTLQADFVDDTGTEDHFFLVQLPSGIMPPAGWTTVTDSTLLASAGMIGTVYYVEAGIGSDNTFSLNVPENFAGGDLHFKAGSYETDVLPPVYEFSADGTASISPTGVINIAPVASIAEEILEDHQTNVAGAVSVFDEDSDSWSVTKVTFDGLDHDVPTDGSPLHVAGDYGTLEITADGSYSYTLNDGVVASDVNAIESFSYTVTDQHGGESDNLIDVTLGTPPTPPSINLAALFDAVGAEAPYGTEETENSHTSGVFGSSSSPTDVDALPDLPPIEDPNSWENNNT